MAMDGSGVMLRAAPAFLAAALVSLGHVGGAGSSSEDHCGLRFQLIVEPQTCAFSCRGGDILVVWMESVSLLGAGVGPASVEYALTSLRTVARCGAAEVECTDFAVINDCYHVVLGFATDDAQATCTFSPLFLPNIAASAGCWSCPLGSWGACLYNTPSVMWEVARTMDAIRGEARGLVCGLVPCGS